MASHVLFLVFALQLLKPASCICSGYSEEKYKVTNGWSSAPADGRKNGGVKASESAAESDSGRLTDKIKKTIGQVTSEKGVDPYIILGIASRESNFGSTLKPDGYGKYDNGNGYGWMQVDKRHHIVDTSSGPSSKNHYLQATDILVDSIRVVSNKHSDWEREYQIKGGIAGYNFGPSNVWTKEGIDKGTTGDDYSSDVLTRAKFFREKRIFD
ncbi:lysozyme g-like [Oscarella lobularis]|uniref:lysozyme g-like n=1 Tax=Oscarella lobularis TaxID=121494 RepID=UPI0033132C10